MCQVFNKCIVPSNKVVYFSFNCQAIDCRNLADSDRHFIECDNIIYNMNIETLCKVYKLKLFDTSKV